MWIVEKIHRAVEREFSLVVHEIRFIRALEASVFVSLLRPSSSALPVENEVFVPGMGSGVFSIFGQE